MKISAIIITYNRIELLKRCIQSLYVQFEGKDHEIIIIVNGSDEDTVNYLKTEKAISFHQIESCTPGEARNFGTKKSNGDYFLFLDDDVLVPENYIAKSEDFIERTSPDVLGGPDSPYPGSTNFEIAISLTLTSPLATATTRFRHISDKKESLVEGNEAKLILCNLFVKSSLFTEEGFKFDSRFFRNEENVLLGQIANANKKIVFSPNLFVYHKRRGNIYELVRAIFSSSRFRLKSILFFPNSFNILYFVPFLFVIYLGLIPVLPSPIGKIPLLLYLVLNFIFSLYIGVRENAFRFVLPISLIQAIINIVYGLGFLYEIVTCPKYLFEKKST